MKFSNFRALRSHPGTGEGAREERLSDDGPQRQHLHARRDSLSPNARRLQHGPRRPSPRAYGEAEGKS